VVAVAAAVAVAVAAGGTAAASVNGEAAEDAAGVASPEPAKRTYVTPPTTMTASRATATMPDVERFIVGLQRLVRFRMAETSRRQRRAFDRSARWALGDP
jgi:hypothetical protein